MKVRTVIFMLTRQMQAMPYHVHVHYETSSVHCVAVSLYTLYELAMPTYLLIYHAS